MLSSFRNFFLLCVFLVSMAGCGGDSSGTSNNDDQLETNSAPRAVDVSILDDNGGEALVGDSLTGSYRFKDSDGDAEGQSRYQWLRDGQPIKGATALNYTLVAADSGAYIGFQVSPVARSGSTFGATVEADSPIFIANSAPVAGGVSIFDNNGDYALVGDTLTGLYSYFDADEDAEGNSVVRWLRNGVVIPGADSVNYTLVDGDEGQAIRFEVTPLATSGITTGNAQLSAELNVGSFAFDVRRLESPGRIEISWSLAGVSANSFNLYYAKNTRVDSDNYQTVEGAVQVLNVTSPYTLPAAFNEYQNVYFTVEALSGNRRILSATGDTVFQHVELNRYNAGGGCSIVAGKVDCWTGNIHSESLEPDLVNPSMISLGSQYVCALDDNGVSCWGDDAWGKTTVPPLLNPRMVSAGMSRTCALDDNGVVCWGLTGGPPEPPMSGYVDYSTLVNPRYIETSDYETCVLDDNGVVCWDSVYRLRSVPILNTPTQLTLGASHACVLEASGVVCWGQNTYDQTDVPSLSNPTQVDAGRYHSCALDDTGVVCWGNNDDHQTDVPPLDNPRQVFAGYKQSCAIDDTGLVCWGGIFPQLSNDINLPAPSQIEKGEVMYCVRNLSDIRCWGDANGTFGTAPIPPMYNPRLVSTGGFHACALDDTGAKCWPDFQSNIPALTNPVDIKAGKNFTCAIDNAGVSCWGENNFRQTTVPAMNNPISITTGEWHACALHDAGISCWGRNNEGQSTVPPLSNPVAVSAGFWDTCAIDDNGVTCWGRNGTVLNEAIPSLSNPIKIGTGNGQVCALDDDGLKCWGASITRDIGLDVPMLFNPYAFTENGGPRCALDDHGIICWGWAYYNGYGWRSQPRY